MTDAKLDHFQREYKLAIEKWVAAIRHAESLASVGHSVTKLDQWEHAHFRADEFRDRALEAKKQYEDALREAQFGF